MRNENLSDAELKNAIAKYQEELAELEREAIRRSWAKKKAKWQVVCDALEEYLEEYGSITVETYDNTYTLDSAVDLSVTAVINMELCVKSY